MEDNMVKDNFEIQRVTMHLPKVLFDEMHEYADKNGMTNTGFVKVAVKNELSKLGIDVNW